MAFFGTFAIRACTLGCFFIKPFPKYKKWFCLTVFQPLFNLTTAFIFSAFILNHICCIILGHSNPQSSTTTWYIISQLRGKWVQRAIWMGRLWSSGGSNWHSTPLPSHHPPQHCQILPSSFLKLTELLAWGLGADPDLGGFCLCHTPMNMNIIICWHQDTTQIKTRLPGLLLLFQARDLN